jgi:hypothetical protein
MLELLGTLQRLPDAQLYGAESPDSLVATSKTKVQRSVLVVQLLMCSLYA